MQTSSELLVKAAALVSAGKLDQAERLAQEARARQPESAVALHILGVVARQTDRLDLAFDLLNRALKLEPDHPGIHFERGAALQQSHRLAEAANSFRRAAELKPDFQEAYVNLGALLERLEKPEEALAACRRAAELEPDCSIAWYNIANSLRSLGRLNEASAAFLKSIQLKPDFAKAHWNLACCALLAGDFQTGWREYEWREPAAEVAIDHYPQPRWRGESLAGKHLLIHAEQGIGDEILFASCWPELIPHAERCIIVCDPRLQQLFTRSFPTAVVYGRPRRKDRGPAELPDRIDYQIPAGSVPGHFRKSLNDFPARRRFLVPNAPLQRQWRERIQQLGDGLKIGISWQAGGQPTERRKRTMTLNAWRPILHLSGAGANFVNLQYGETVDEIAAIEQAIGIQIHDPPGADPLVDLDAFAAKVAALDLVISVGNATVHIAGALGVSTWNLVPKVPGWRWMIEGEQSIWYPSVRLFRQRERGDWQPVLETVERELSQLLTARGVAARSSTLKGTGNNTRTRQVESAVKPDRSTTDDNPVGLSRLSDVTALTDLAREAFNRGDLSRTEALCKGVLEHAPRNLKALQLSGLAACGSGRRDVAARMFERAIAINDSDPELHFQLGLCHSEMGNTAQAVEHFRRGTQLSPGHAAAQFALGQSLWVLGQPREACDAFQQATVADPQFVKALNALGAARLALKQQPAAEQALRRAIALRPDYVAAWHNLGLTLQEAGRCNEAAHCFRRALEFDSSFGPARSAMAAMEAATMIEDHTAAVRLDTPHGQPSLMPDRPAAVARRA